MSDIGLYSLRFALAIAAFGVAVGVAAGVRKRADWTQVAERCLLATFAFIVISMGALFYALATNDFSIAYVTQHSARSMTLPYRMAALWGGQSGSLLLWVFMLGAYGAVTVWANRRKNRSLMPSQSPQAFLQLYVCFPPGFVPSWCLVGGTSTTRARST